jgi:NAD-dependent DNA ligase
MDKIITNIIIDPINTLDTLSKAEVVKILKAADDAFFHTQNILLTDDIYDIVKEYLRKKDPRNPYLKKVGAQIEFNKEKLPFYIGSLDKIKDDEKAILKWKKTYTGDYVVSQKLDGISCLLYYDNGVMKLFSRGDGKEGQNITHILPFLQLDVSAIKNKIAIRGELIISKANWKLLSGTGANARNVVAGAIHSKTINKEIVSKIDFVAYDILYPRLKLSESFERLQELHIPLVKYQQINDTLLTLELLSNTLQDCRNTGKYEIDGIVVYHNAEHKIVAGKNPKYAFAFKTILTHEQAEVIVTDVEWNISKHRYLKPIVKFNEVNLNGVKIKQATGFNAAYIEKHKIGAGARVIIVRSGDVIPHIIEVLKPAANNQAKMPNVPYIWNDTHIDIMLSGSDKNREQDIQVFSHFMKTLSITGVKEGVITKLYDSGYDTLHKIVHITIEDLKLIDGFQDKSSQKIYDALQLLKDIDCHKLMVASNIFGRNLGEKKLKLIIDKYPFITKDKQKALQLSKEDLMQIEGIAMISAKQFLDNLPKFYTFSHELGIKCKDKNEVNMDIDAKFKKIFQNMTVVFSGFRDSNLEKIINDVDGKVVTAVSGSTNILIVKDITDITTKIKKAQDLGINIMTKDDVDKLLN